MNSTKKRNPWINGEKVCPGCNTSKSESEYYDGKGSNSKSSRCRECVAADNKAWQEANPEKYAAIQKAWREANEGHTYTDEGGYVKYIGYSHPIANPSGITPYHRIVLWNKIGPGEHACHWGCGKTVSWDINYRDDYHRGLVVDHVNNVKQDNRPENLVPACQECNTKRMVPIREALRPKCAFEGCEHKVLGKGELCKGHYMQKYVGKELKPLRNRVFKDENGKECSGCKTYKTWDDYYSRSNGVGYQNQCKPCMIEHNAKNTLARKGKKVAA